MSVEILDGSTIREFVEDEGAFNGSVEEWFASLDMDRDGRLTYSEMARELMSLRVRETHFGVDEAGPSRDELLQLHLGLFRRFDRDGNGTVELEEFRAGVPAGADGGGGGRQLPQEGGGEGDGEACGMNQCPTNPTRILAEFETTKSYSDSVFFVSIVPNYAFG